MFIPILWVLRKSEGREAREHGFIAKAQKTSRG
jgi:hypothetical protein